MNVEDEVKLITNIKNLIENNPTYSIKNMKHIFGTTCNTIKKMLNKLGYTYYLPYWMPELDEKHIAERIVYCMSFINHNADDSYLKQIITTFEKCIVYKMYISNTEFYLKKAMVCIWWDWKGFIHAKVLPDTTVIDANIYCSHLDELESTIKEVRPELVDKIIKYHHSKPDVLKSVQILNKIKNLDWSVIVHPSYSCDLSPSDYYLSRAVHFSLRNKHFTSFQEFKNHIFKLCESLNELPESPLMALPKKWQMVVDRNGQYILL